MEVITVFPSAISPTEGDDLCEIDVTSVAINSVTLLIGLCGLVGNGAVLCLLRLKFINVIFYLVFTDFVVLLFTVPSILIFLLEDVSCSPIMPLMYLRFLFQLSVLSYYWGLFRLRRISIVNDLYKLCCCCRVPERLLWLVWRAQYWVFFTLIAVIPTVTFLCPSHEQEFCRVSLISVYILILLLVAAPVVTSSTINSIKGKRGSQQKLPKRGGIVIFFIVLCTLLLILWNFLQQLGYINVSSHVVFLLSCINSSIRPFIYFLVGTSWRHCSMGGCWRHCTVGSLRDSLRRVFEETQENTPSSNDATMDTVI